MKNALAMLIVVALVGAATSVSAHWPFRVIGTITRVTDREMDVKDDNKTLKINLTIWTTVKRDKEEAKLPLSVLKVGQSVVVDAEGDNETKLDARDIRIVPPIGSKPST